MSLPRSIKYGGYGGIDMAKVTFKKALGVKFKLKQQSFLLSKTCRGGKHH
jgi:hypothetical protein